MAELDLFRDFRLGLPVRAQTRGGERPPGWHVRSRANTRARRGWAGAVVGVSS